MVFNTRVFGTWVGVTLLFLSAAVVSAAAPSRDDALSRVSISNFAMVDADYYRGAQPKGDDYADLAALGIKTVIDLTKDGESGEQRAVEAQGMNFHRIPMTTHSRPDEGAVRRFLALVNDPANQPVYVHCQGGRHRTGAMTAVYRMTEQGWTADRAYAEMKRHEFDKGYFHEDLKQFVYDYFGNLGRSRAAAAAGQ